MRLNAAKLQELWLHRWIASTSATLLEVGAEVAKPSNANNEGHQMIVYAGVGCWRCQDNPTTEIFLINARPEDADEPVCFFFRGRDTIQRQE